MTDEMKSDSAAMMPNDTAQYPIQVAGPCRLRNVFLVDMEGTPIPDTEVAMLIAGSRTLVRTDCLSDGESWEGYLEKNSIVAPEGSWLIAVGKNNGKDVVAGEALFRVTAEDKSPSPPQPIQPVERVRTTVHGPRRDTMPGHPPEKAAITSPGRDTAPDDTPVDLSNGNHVTVFLQRSEAERLLVAARGGYAIQSYELPGIERALRVALGEIAQ
jgi:hypothetical protein